MNPLLKWEIDWVRANGHFYDSVQHQEHVIHCITNYYKWKEREAAVKRFAETKTTKDQYDMFELFGVNEL